MAAAKKPATKKQKQKKQAATTVTKRPGPSKPSAAAAAAAAFDRNYAKLVAFHSEFGHCNVTSRHHRPYKTQYHSLSICVEEWRRKFSQGRMPEKHQKALGALGFVFQPREEKWNAMLQQTRLYLLSESKPQQQQTQNAKAFKKIEIWMAKQKKEFQEGTLDPERKRKLEDIGFILMEEEKKTNTDAEKILGNQVIQSHHGKGKTNNKRSNPNEDQRNNKKQRVAAVAVPEDIYVPSIQHSSVDTCGRPWPLENADNDIECGEQEGPNEASVVVHTEPRSKLDVEELTMASSDFMTEDDIATVEKESENQVSSSSLLKSISDRLPVVTFLTPKPIKNYPMERSSSVATTQGLLVGTTTTSNVRSDEAEKAEEGLLLGQTPYHVPSDEATTAEAAAVTSPSDLLCTFSTVSVQDPCGGNHSLASMRSSDGVGDSHSLGSLACGPGYNTTILFESFAFQLCRVGGDSYMRDCIEFLRERIQSHDPSVVLPPEIVRSPSGHPPTSSSLHHSLVTLLAEFSMAFDMSTTEGKQARDDCRKYLQQKTEESNKAQVEKLICCTNMTSSSFPDNKRSLFQRSLDEAVPPVSP